MIVDWQRRRRDKNKIQNKRINQKTNFKKEKENRSEQEDNSTNKNIFLNKFDHYYCSCLLYFHHLIRFNPFLRSLIGAKQATATSFHPLYSSHFFFL